MKKQDVTGDPNDSVCFNTIDEVPTHAITLTVPALFKTDYAYAVVPSEKRRMLFIIPYIVKCGKISPDDYQKT